MVTVARPLDGMEIRRETVAVLTNGARYARWRTRESVAGPDDDSVSKKLNRAPTASTLNF